MRTLIALVGLPELKICLSERFLDGVPTAVMLDGYSSVVLGCCVMIARLVSGCGAGRYVG